MEPVLDPADLNRLKWRCRRGLLENDLLIERFFHSCGENLTAFQAQGLQKLMELPDNDLLDLFLGRKDPQGDLNCASVWHVLQLIRKQPS